MTSQVKNGLRTFWSQSAVPIESFSLIPCSKISTHARMDSMDFALVKTIAIRATGPEHELAL